MAIPLKYNTASQEIPLGHFLDSGDGDAEEDGLTIANTDIKLWKSGATTLANKNSGGATNISNGVYYAVLDATDTNTYGPMVVFVHVSGALAVRLECIVMEADAYDALYAASGTGVIESDLRQIGGVAQSATDLKDFADDGYDPSTNKVQGVVLVDTLTTYTGNTLQTGDAYAVVNDGTYGNAQLVRSTTPANTLDVDASGDVTAGTVGDKTGYSLTQTFPTNFADLAITVTTGEVTVGTNNDKTGYALTQAFPTNFADLSISITTGLVDITQTAADKAWSTATRLLTAGTNIVLAKGVGVTGFNDIAATDVVSAGAITTLTGAVVNVDTVDACTTVTNLTNAPTSGDLTATMKTSVNSEVADVLKTDTISEMAQGIPPTTPTFEEAVMYLYMALRNLVDVDSGFKEFNNNAGTVIWKKALADDGSNYTEAKGTSGP